MNCRRFLLAALAASATLLTLPVFASNDYPSKPINLIVPFAAGGPSDALARQVAQRLGQRLGQQVIVENVPGAGGSVGLARAAKAAPDGHTLAFGTIGTHVANVAVYRKLPYDPIADFEPVAMLGSAPMVLLVNSNVPAKDLREFSSYLQANKDKVSYGSAGVGSISHFGCVLLLSAMKNDVVHVPYRGVGPALTDLMGGQIKFMCDQTTTAIPQSQSGKLRIIAALSKQRLAVLPNVQTTAEAGFGDAQLRAWNALFAPKGTPPQVIKRLNDELAQVLSDSAFRAEMDKVGVELPLREALNPAAVTAAIQSGLQRDVPLLKARGEYLD